MSTASNAIFTGTSRFSNDFQQVINRSVAIASLPITQLTNGKTTLSNQATAINSLQTKFSSLETALKNLGNSTGLSSLSTSISDIGIARVSVANGASPATYSLEVQSLGTFSNSLSAASTPLVSDPTTQNISNASSFLVTVDGTATRITSSSSSLSDLVAALNNTPGLNLQASLVNVGSSGTPDYRLSVQSTKLGNVGIQINDGSTDLLDTVSTGTLASYKVNGLPTPISSNSRSITLAPGVTAELVGQSASGVAATVTVTRQSLTIGNALSAFVTSYNSAAGELDLHRGKGGGALAGNSIIQELGNKLRSIGNFSAFGGQLTSLASLGVTFDGKGHLSYDSAAFAANSSGKLASVIEFLGSSAQGGFLKTATSTLASVGDPTSGLLKTAGNAIDSRLTQQQALIDSNQERVDRLRTNLLAQLAKADSQVAALEQSYNVLSGIFQAQEYNNRNR